MNTNITTNAIAGINQDKQTQVVDLAQAKICFILKEQQQVAKYRENIKVHQEALAKLAEDVLTAEQVLGRPASTSPTVSEVTILKAIAKRNEEKAKFIESNSKSHVAEIDGYNKSIAGCQERIVALRKELDALAADVVTVDQVVG